MTMTKKTLALSLLAALTSAPAMADLSGNVGAVSNYIWRGVTQSGDLAAVQGGVDYTSGALYAGAWTSSLGGGDYETDLYAGYKFDLSGVTLDVGVIDYLYPVETAGADDSFMEGYVGVSKDAFSAKLSYSPDVALADGADETGMYIEAAYTAGPATFHVGSYDFEDSDDYQDVGVTFTKDEFSIGLTKNNIDAAGADDLRIFVGFKKSLGL